ncbi:MAG: respiratory nitrate reductase subunit gamma [Gracilibacteraceae bacterium]|jgi:nitrate reductase gamma subunit|nr:respiratory nitrate reductase subunit gamma [Gracilibacteraceae bacterium]
MLFGIGAYVAAGLFLALSALRAYRLNRLPLHGRMELYPAPAEKGRKHGGSYLEEPEWWTKPRQVSHMAELAEMGGEIVFIKRLFHGSRSFWLASWPFHFGMYCLFVWTLLLILTALTGAGNVEALRVLTALCGFLGFLLGGAGSLILLARRLADKRLRIYTTPQEYLNLILLFAAFLTGACLWFGDGLFSDSARLAMRNILTLSYTPPGVLAAVHLLLVYGLLIYIPIGKMSHYVGKFFAYHRFLWDNAANLKNSGMAAQVDRALKNKPQTVWSAPHANPAPAAGQEGEKT